MVKQFYPKKCKMVNEEIIGGLISALSRGEPLEKAMMTFYNAGYDREEIEGSAKVVYAQLGPQAMGIKSSLQEALDEIAIKVGADKIKSNQMQNNNSSQDSSNISQLAIQKRTPEMNSFNKNNFNSNNEKYPQRISSYGEENPVKYDSGAEQLANKIEMAVKNLKQMNIPSKIEIINRNIESKSPQVIQKVSAYKESPPKQFNKAITYLLIFVLIFLLGILGAVFFFKDDLINMFNNAGLG